MIKKLVIGGILLVVVVVGIALLWRADLGLANPWLDGQIEKAELGDLAISVTATGTIEPSRTIQIKSKAGGQVSKIHVVEGQMVKTGDLLVELDPVDERRNVEAREADLKRAKSAWEKAKIAVQNYKVDLPLQTQLAKARLDDASARLDDAAFRWDKVQKYVDRNPSEEITTKSAFLVAKAAKEQAETDYERAKNNEDIVLRGAVEDEKQAEALQEVADKALDEANLRFKETTVQARSDGMVYSIMIHEGEMIQSGVASITGGTVLMILADTSAMFVMAQVDEADIGAIRKVAPDYARPGLTEKLDEEVYKAKAQEVVDRLQDRIVDVKVDAYRRDKYSGVIERILPEPIRVSGALAFKVRIRLVGEDLEKLMGLQADLAFTNQKETGLVLVKNEALHSEGRVCYVFVPVDGKPRDEKRVEVEIGMTDGRSTEIKSGLKPGDAVFTKRPQKTEKEKEQDKAQGNKTT